jgi:hypothetical protein
MKEQSAENEEEAEGLAIKYAKNDHDSHNWRDCSIYDLNYQVESIKV